MSTSSSPALGFLADGGDGYPLPALAEDVTDLVAPEGAPATGAAAFVVDGTEQDALAEFLAANFAEVPFDNEETDPAEEQRIQILGERNDTVLEMADLLDAEDDRLNGEPVDGSTPVDDLGANGLGEGGLVGDIAPLVPAEPAVN